MSKRTHTFHVKGMHCNACVVLTESELNKVPGVLAVKASLKHLNVEVTGEFGDRTAEDIARDLTGVLRPYGYELLLERQARQTRWSDFKIALPISLGFVIGFWLLQRLGIANLINTSEVTYGAAFIIGLVASVSTCMAVVGGLVLSLSANQAKRGSGAVPQILFHLGRLVSFFILGGLIGVLGATFQLGQGGIFILSLLVAIVLILLGINLLDVFPRFKRWQPVLPTVLGRRIHGIKDVNHALTPLFLGVTTFFLPCGFTQSMQIYTLTTGNFWTGAMTMFVFALGTLPVLALLSFSFLGLKDKPQSSIFFKSAGLVVIFFGLVNLINSLVVFGLIPPVFSF